MPTALRGGTETHWRVWGDEAAPALLLHCSLAHSGAWQGLAPLLGRSSIAFDAPGHGRSGPVDPAQDYQVQCLRVAEDFVRAGAMDLIGHSFGATVALRLAAERPEAVRRLVLIEPVLFAAARGTAALTRLHRDIAPYVEAMERNDYPAAAEAFTAIWGSGVPWDRLRESDRQTLSQMVQVIPAQNGALFDDNAGILAPGRLERMNLPVLLVEGGASPPVIAAIHDTLERRLPDVRRAVVPGAGHMLPITHPRAVADLVAPFLSP